MGKNLLTLTVIVLEDLPVRTLFSLRNPHRDEDTLYADAHVWDGARGEMPFGITSTSFDNGDVIVLVFSEDDPLFL